MITFNIILDLETIYNIFFVEYFLSQCSKNVGLLLNVAYIFKMLEQHF